MTQNSSASPFQGVYTALVTPLKADGKVAFDELTRLVEWQIESGIDGLIPAGTTGESPTLDPQEHIDVIRCVVDAAAGRVPVIAGAGANATAEAIHLTKGADKAGANGFLQVSPYYNKPSQEGQFQHFSAIADLSDKPIILYSIPGRCVVEIGVETVVRLADKYPHVRTIKESGGTVVRASQLIHALGDRITILSGEDERTLPYISVGASGVISVASNIAPKLVKEMVDSALAGDLKTATRVHQKLFPLFRDLFCETSPAPIKYALKRKGILSTPQTRLPLVPITSAGAQQLDQTLSALGL